MLPDIGAAAAAIDALKSLTSSKSKTTTGFAQASNPFEQSGGTQASTATGTGTTTGGSGFTQISPQTLTSARAAQSQSATGSTTSASPSRSSALKDLFSKI